MYVCVCVQMAALKVLIEIFSPPEYVCVYVLGAIVCWCVCSDVNLIVDDVIMCTYVFCDVTLIVIDVTVHTHAFVV